MFRQLAALLPSPEVLFDAHPLELAWLLEEIWRQRIDDVAGKSLGDPDRRSNLDAMPRVITRSALGDALAALLVDRELPRRFRWDHLIYAYMIENTRVYEIFRRVLHEFLHGEVLGVPTPEAQGWLRNTEELFYRDPPPFSITTITSHIRADLRASRRNAYQRMFGMDLNHGADDGQPYPY